MDIKQLTDKPVAELQELLQQSRLSADEMAMKARQNQLKNIRELRGLKRTIARIMTVLHQKQTS